MPYAGGTRRPRGRCLVVNLPTSLDRPTFPAFNLGTYFLGLMEMNSPTREGSRLYESSPVVPALN